MLVVCRQLVNCAHLFAEEDDVRLDQAPARLVVAPDDLAFLYRFAHLGRIVLLLAVDAVLGREAPVSFYELIRGDAGLPLECVDVLREACVQQTRVREQLHECVRQRWPIAARVELAGQCVN